MAKTLHRLDEVDSGTSIGDKLQKCLDLDIPVLIKVPTSMDVWGIDPKLERLTKKDVVLSEPNVVKRIPLILELLDGQCVSPLDTPNIHTSGLAASTKLEDVPYLQLRRSDVLRLLAISQLEINRFDAAFMFDDESGEYGIRQSMPVPKYSFTVEDRFHTDGIDSRLVQLDPFDSRYTKNILHPNQELNFVLCARSCVEEQYNHPVEIINSCPVKLSECWILGEHLSHLTFDNSNYESSRYFLEPKFYISTSFVEFSKSAFDLLEKGEKPISGGTSGYLCSKHKCFKAKYVSEGGTRIINLIKQDAGRDCFEKLKVIFERYWVAQPIKGKAEARRVTQDVIYELEHKLELKSSNASGVEMILRPDKYK